MNNNGDDFEDDLAAYNERQKEDEGDGDIEQQAVTAIPEFNPVINNNIYSSSISKADQNLEDIELEQPQPKNLSEKEEEEEEDEEGFYKDEEEEMDAPVSIQEIKPL